MHEAMIEGAPREPERSTDGLPVEQVMIGCPEIGIPADHWITGRMVKHGLPPQRYRDLFAAQGGVCAICGAEPKTEALMIDHCHATSAVRGLLCRRCNTGLGFFKDVAARLRAAADYLDAYRSSETSSP